MLWFERKHPMIWEKKEKQICVTYLSTYPFSCLSNWLWRIFNSCLSHKHTFSQSINKQIIKYQYAGIYVECPCDGENIRSFGRRSEKDFTGTFSFSAQPVNKKNRKHNDSQNISKDIKNTEFLCCTIKQMNKMGKKKHK